MATFETVNSTAATSQLIVRLYMVDGTTVKKEPNFNKEGIPYIPYRFAAWNDALVAVEIPEGVSGIVGGAFEGCSSLTKVNIPKSVGGIGNDAFKGCPLKTVLGKSRSFAEQYAKNLGLEFKTSPINGLEYDITPDGATVIRCADREAQRINIPDQINGVPVTKIGEWAFSHCSSLIEVHIPDSVTEIEFSAFAECSALKKVRIPDSVTKIWAKAFWGCDALEEVCFNPLTEHGFNTFNCITSVLPPIIGWKIVESGIRVCRVQTNSATKIEIPGKISGLPVTEIGDNAFDDCSSLTKVVIPNSVKRIGDYAFRYCSSLTEINIPNGVTKIGVSAFRECSSLTEIVLPDSVTEIGDRAFSWCSSLTEATLPFGITKISNGLFAHCGELKKCNIPATVTKIGEDAFSYCPSLTSIKVPDSVTEIKNEAFAEGVGFVRLPASLKKINARAFRYEVNLILPKGEFEMIEGEISGIIYCPEGTKIYNAGDTRVYIVNRGVEKFDAMPFGDPLDRMDLVDNFRSFLADFSSASISAGFNHSLKVGEITIIFPMEVALEDGKVRLKSGVTSAGKALYGAVKKINKVRLEKGQTPFCPFKSDLDQYCELFTVLVETGEMAKNSIDLVVNDKFDEIYDPSKYTGSFGSCMAGEGLWTFFNDAFNKNPDEKVRAQAASIRNAHGEILARCIIWSEVRTKSGKKIRIADRQYGETDRYKALLVKKLIEAEEIDAYKSYDASCHDAGSFKGVDGRWLSHQNFEIDIDLDVDGTVSYMDTFKWFVPTLGKAYNYNPCLVYKLDTTGGTPCRA